MTGRKTILLRTNSKVNLFLRILGPRPDGYHEVETILHGVGLADEIALEPAEDGVGVAMATPWGDELPFAEDNLITRAAEALMEHAGVRRGARIEVTKNIPVGAGLGGGSGNAAGALVALAELWGLELGHEALLEIGRSLGADVPYCIEGGTALATGRGDELTRMPPPEELHLVLGISDIPLLTRDVYAAYDELEGEDGVGSAPALTLALGSGDTHEIAGLIHNDLERAAVALRPELAAKKSALQDAGALAAMVSGSGPTLMGIALEEAHAETVAARVRDHFARVEVVRSAPRCIERLD